MNYTLGESLLDIIINSTDDAYVRPGGAMLNTAVSLGRSNIDVSLISELGDDNTSKLITDFLLENNVNTTYLKYYQNNNSCLALAFLDKNKKPSYSFVKNYPNQRNLIINQEFNSDDILLFGSLYSLDTAIRDSIVSILESAKRNNSIIIYDPNIRNPEHLTNKRLKDALIENINVADIIKGSDEDFENIFGTSDIQLQIENIRKINNKALLIITQGPVGVVADYLGSKTTLPALPTKLISTIGAGDAFNAGIIYYLTKTPYSKNNFNISEMLSSGLRFSAEVCSTKDNYISR